MTTTAQLLIHAYGRNGGIVHEGVDGPDEAALTARVAPQANPTARPARQLARVRDNHAPHPGGRFRRPAADPGQARPRPGAWRHNAPANAVTDRGAGPGQGPAPGASPAL